MKKSVFILFIIFTSYYNLNAQSGWLLLRPYPNNAETISSFYFPNKNTGYIVNSSCYINCYSVIYKTTDAGLNWLRIYLSTTSYIKSLYFLSSDTGFCSMNNYLYKTKDGGLNWIYKGSYVSEVIDFADLYTGYTVGGTEYGPKIQKSTNGGESWQYIDPNISGWYNWMRDIKFFNSNTGLFCGDQYYLYKTTNGGFNWNSVYDPDWGIFYSISIVNNSLAFVAGNGGKILKSTNQGQNWTTYQYSNFSIEKNEFFDENTGYASYFDNSNYLDFKGVLIKTTNGCNNWQIVTEIPEYDDINCFHFFNKNEGYLYQSFGDLLKTTNGGNNWKSDIPRDNFNSIKMLNGNTGFSGGTNGLLYKTTNGSSNWMDVSWHINNSFSGSSINDIYFFNLKKGLILSDSGKIFVTNDSAYIWNTVTTNTNSKLNRTIFLDDNTGIAVGNNGTVIRTTNSALNWTTININSSAKLNSICKTTSANLFICGDTTYIYKSTNSGINWNILSIASTKHFNSISFKNDYLGFVVGDSGITYKTTNGGTNWQLVNIDTYEKLNCVAWFNDSSVCAIGNNNTIRISRNNGNYWGWPIDSTGNPGYDRIQQGHLNYAQFINNNTGFICGNFGLIERTNDGGGTMINGINNYNINISSYILFQNYPNPFNPVTKIRYIIPNIGQQKYKMVILKIFNILGQEISILVNKKQNPGVYEVKWDGSRFPSGIYFYQLKTDNIIETKKMVLLK